MLKILQLQTLNTMKLLKSTAVISLFLSVCSIGYAQIDTIHVETLQLNGKIKKVEDFSYILESDPKGDEFIDGQKYSRIPLNEDWRIELDEKKYSKTNISYLFDKSGKNIETTSFYAEKRPIGDVVFTYDDEGKVIKSVDNFNLSDGVFTVEKRFFYNEKKHLVKIDEYEGETWITTTTFKYDDLGNCIERNKVANVSSLEKDVRRYEQRNLIYENNIRLDYTKENKYMYNSENKVIESEVVYPKQGVFLKQKHDYNGDYLVETKYLNEENQETICQYRYQGGKLVETVYTATDDPSFRFVKKRIYGSSGDSEIIKKNNEVIAEKKYNEKRLLKTHTISNFVYKYKYVFDKLGNWTKVVFYENETPTKVRFRTIQYY